MSPRRSLGIQDGICRSPPRSLADRPPGRDAGAGDPAAGSRDGSPAKSWTAGGRGCREGEGEKVGRVGERVREGGRAQEGNERRDRNPTQHRSKTSRASAACYLRRRLPPTAASLCHAGRAAHPCSTTPAEGSPGPRPRPRPPRPRPRPPLRLLAPQRCVTSPSSRRARRPVPLPPLCPPAVARCLRPPTSLRACCHGPHPGYSSAGDAAAASFSPAALGRRRARLRGPRRRQGAACGVEKPAAGRRCRRRRRRESAGGKRARHPRRSSPPTDPIRRLRRPPRSLLLPPHRHHLRPRPRRVARSLCAACGGLRRPSRPVRGSRRAPLDCLPRCGNFLQSRAQPRTVRLSSQILCASSCLPRMPNRMNWRCAESEDEQFEDGVPGAAGQTCRSGATLRLRAVPETHPVYAHQTHFPPNN